MKDKIIVEVDAARGEDAAREADMLRVLRFFLGKEEYAVDITQAREVFRADRVTRVPGAPAYIPGVTNRRGQIVSIIDVRYFLGLPAARLSQEVWVLVTDVGRSAVGILVDRIREATKIDRTQIQPPLASLSETQLRYTEGQIAVDGGIMTVLDISAMLSGIDLERLGRTHD